MKEPDETALVGRKPERWRLPRRQTFWKRHATEGQIPCVENIVANDEQSRAVKRDTIDPAEHQILVPGGNKAFLIRGQRMANNRGVAGADRSDVRGGSPGRDPGAGGGPTRGAAGAPPDRLSASVPLSTTRGQVSVRPVRRA